MLCSDEAQHTDVAALKTFVPNTAMDYLGVPANLVTVKQLNNPTALHTRLGEKSDYICQLNYVFVQTPEADESILTQDARLWGKFSVWDASGKGDCYTRHAFCLGMATPEVCKDYDLKGRAVVVNFANGMIGLANFPSAEVEETMAKYKLNL